MNDKDQCPTILYKYRAINDFSRKIFSDGEIYFASSDELNDVFEKFFFYTREVRAVMPKSELDSLKIKPIKQSTSDGLSYHVLLTPEGYTNYILNALKRNEAYGILSLCESKEAIPMYAHYADGFKGICIGFDWKIFSLNVYGSYPLQKNVPSKVIYELNPPRIERSRPEEWVSVYRTKSIDFKWENEWRIFYKKGIYRDYNVRAAIKEIIFGYNTTEEQREQIKELIADLDDVKLYMTEPVVGQFKLQIIPLNEFKK